MTRSGNHPEKTQIREETVSLLVPVHSRTGDCWTRSGNHPEKTQIEEKTVSLLVQVYTRTGGCWTWSGNHPEKTQNREETVSLSGKIQIFGLPIPYYMYSWRFLYPDSYQEK